MLKNFKADLHFYYFIFHQEHLPTENSPVRIIKDSATSPTRPVGPLRRSATFEDTPGTPSAPHPTPTDSDPRPNLGPGAIFSNSAVSIVFK